MRGMMKGKEALMLLCVFGALLAPLGSAVAFSGGAGAGSPPSGEVEYKVREEAVLVDVDGEPITAGQIVDKAYLVNQAGDRQQAAQVVTGILEGKIVDRLVLAEARRRDLLSSPRYTVPVRLVRNIRLADTYMAKNYDEMLAPTEEEMEPLLPREWTTMRLHAIYMNDREDALKAREEIAKNSDRFDEMYEKYSEVQTGSMGDMGYLLPKSGFFTVEEDPIVFSLEKGDISPVLSVNIGFAIVKVEDKRALTEGEKAAHLGKLRESMRGRKLSEHMQKLRESHQFEVDKTALDEAVEDLLALKRKDRVVAVLDGVEITFFDLKNAQVRPPETLLTPVGKDALVYHYSAYLEKAMLGWSVAAEAREAGYAYTTKQVGGVEPLILTRILGAEVLRDVVVDEDEVRAHYDQNPQLYAGREMYEMRRIVLSSRDAAEEVRRSLLEDPGSFARLAEEVSEDPFVTKHGSTAVFKAYMNSYPDYAREALRHTDKGGISPILERDGKFYIFKVEEKQENHTIPYETVRWEAYRKLLGKKQSLVISPFIADLKAKAEIVFHQKNIDEFTAAVSK